MCRALGALVVLTLALASPAMAQDSLVGKDDFGGFRNVLAVGQGEGANAAELARFQATGAFPTSFTSQLAMYRDLVYAAPALKAGDLDTYFKSASFGVKTADIGSTVQPRPGVTIVRDSTHFVPRIYGVTRSDTMFGAGYASAEDRLFMMDVLRHYARGRLSELAGPGTGDANLKSDAEQLMSSGYNEEELAGMIDSAAARVPNGAQLKQDLTDYVAGVNAFIAEARMDPEKMPGEYAALGRSVQDWKGTDSVAIASLIGGIFGRGGGREALGSLVLAEAQKRFGPTRGRRVFEDFRRREDSEAPITVTRRFPFQNQGRVSSRAVAVLDPDSLKVKSPVVSGTSATISPASRQPAWLRGLGLSGPSSNALLVTAKRSASGRPIAVMGPQVGFYSPEILLELELHGPGIDARGAAFPGISLYVLIGRGKDFAWSATTATADNVDEFVERLCEPDGSSPTTNSTHYLYKGRCRPMIDRSFTMTSPAGAGAAGDKLRTIRMRVLRTVHGPVQYTGTVRSQPVAVAEARSTFMHEIDSTAAFEKLNTNQVTDAASFQRAMSLVNFSFNWFYADERDIAFIQSGHYPVRTKGTDPSLPAWGTGAFDWRGFDEATFGSRKLPFSRLPKTINPSQGYIVSWNNKAAPGWRSSDSNWAYGSVHRSERLEDPLRRSLRGGAKVDLARLVQIVAQGATIDPRGQEVYPVIRKTIGSTRGDAEAGALLTLLDAWSRSGSHRRDLDKDDSLDDGPAVALMDAWFARLVDTVYRPVLGRDLIQRIADINIVDDLPVLNNVSSFFDGWYGYVQKDLRTLLGRPVLGRFSRRYCGGGSRRLCRELLLASLKDAASEVARAQGADRSQWKVPATCPIAKPKRCDQTEFTTVGAIRTAPIPWQDRPTFQQVIEVQGHRPRP